MMGGFGGSGMMGRFGGSDLGMYGLVGGLFMLVFWIALILLIALGIRWLVTSTGTSSSSPGSVHADEAALDVLKKRYAQGEIDTQEFEERKKALSS